MSSSEIKTAFLVGCGFTGSRHLDALLTAEANGTPIATHVIEPDPNRRKDAELQFGTHGIPSHNRLFASLDDAFAQGKTPQIVVNAGPDQTHFDVLERCLKYTEALFSEKPLTEHQHQTDKLRGQLKKKFVAMNTVINFSPVFDLFDAQRAPGGALHGLEPIGFEGVWGNNLLNDKRRLIGVRGDALHPIGVIAEMLGQKSSTLQKGYGRLGHLTAHTGEIVYSLTDSHWQTEKGLPVRLSSDYAYHEKRREVRAYFQKGDQVVAAEFKFDIEDLRPGADPRRLVDTLQLHDIDPKTGKVTSHPVRTADPQDVYMGAAEAGTHDKMRAFVGNCLEKLFGGRRPGTADRLSNFEEAERLQTSVNVIQRGPEGSELQNGNLTLVRGTSNARVNYLMRIRDLGETQEKLPFAVPLADARETNVLGRLAWFAKPFIPRPRLLPGDVFADMAAIKLPTSVTTPAP